MKTIILASTSPRRKALLENLGLKFQVESSGYRENRQAGIPPEEQVKLFSREKAARVASRHRHALVIAADTMGIYRGEILGKPVDASDARRMLGKLSGKAHTVITGFTIIESDTGKSFTGAVRTRVYFRKMSAGEIDAYVNSGEPRDKAGAYAIQGRGSVIVEKIDGDFYNIIGLPLCALAEGLKEFGVSILESSFKSHC